jgi:lambda repressor-like predicted transcriptional regulator
MGMGLGKTMAKAMENQWRPIDRLRGAAQYCCDPEAVWRSRFDRLATTKAL